MILVAAVGNASDTSVIGSPASHPGALAIGGVDKTGRLSKQSISGEAIDLVAPSDDIVAAQPGGKYSTSTGISSATAIASGIVALVKSKYPDLGGYDMHRRLVGTSVDAGEKGFDEAYGYGIIDLMGALTREPDNRGMSKEEAREKGIPVPEGETPPAGVDWDAWADQQGFEADPWYEGWQIVLPILLVLIALVVGAILLLRRWLRKRRAGSPGPEEPGGPAGPGGVTPSQPTPDDDSAWRPTA